MTLRRSTELVNRQNGYGSTVVVNGTFDTDPTVEWNETNSTILSIAGGQSGNALEITETGGTLAGKCYQDITTIVGNVYEFSAYFKRGSSAAGKVFIGTATVEDSLFTSADLTDATWTILTHTFIATETTTRVTLQSNSIVIGETSNFDTVIVSNRSARLTDLLNSALINIYTGSQVADCDAASAGTLLATVSNNSTGTGVTFTALNNGTVTDNTTEIWSGDILANGDMGWFRLYIAGDDPDISATNLIRIDGEVGIDNTFDMIVASVTLSISDPDYLIRSFLYTVPTA